MTCLPLEHFTFCLWQRWQAVLRRPPFRRISGNVEDEALMSPPYLEYDNARAGYYYSTNASAFLTADWLVRLPQLD